MNGIGKRSVDQSWCYRGEGNQNLVISYLDDRRVLRLTKLKSDSSGDDGRVRNEILKNFSQNVMKPLLGSFVPSVDLIFISREVLDELSHRIQRFRPGARKDEFCTFGRCGLLLPDCAFIHNSDEKLSKTIGPTIAVEIKPKMGFLLPNCVTCRYSLMQRKKLKDGKIDTRSTYCPIDLFSGCPSRMKRAIKALMENPQNNFRIFKDGNLIYGEETSPAIGSTMVKLFNEMQEGCWTALDACDTLCELITTALLHEPSADHADRSYHALEFCGCNGKGNLESSGNGLPTGCVLGRVLNVQKLDLNGVEKLYPSYEKFREEFKHVLDDKMNDCLYNNYEVNSTWKQLNCKQQDLLITVRNFLLSATCKDCSIMIAFQRCSERINDVKEGSSLIRDQNGTSYEISINILDLDIKPHARIAKYHEDEHHFRD